MEQDIQKPVLLEAIDDIEQGREDLLKLCYEVRERLKKYVPELRTDFPILECVDENMMGWCKSEEGEWKNISDKKRMADLVKIKRIEVRLVDENNPRVLLPVSSVVFTMIHELAHSITPTVMVKGVASDSKNGKSSKHWQYDNHGPEFYESFQKLLKAAESNDIYVLPKRHFSLKRFDKIDLCSQLLPVGRVPFMESEETKKKCLEEIRLTVVSKVKIKKKETEKKKVIIVKMPVELDDVLEITKTKFNLKGKFCLTYLDGTEFSDVEKLENDMQLKLAKRNEKEN